MENNFIGLIFALIVFLTFWCLIPKIIITVVKNEGNNIFTQNFNKVVEQIDAEPLHKFSVRLISFDLPPKMFGVILPYAIATVSGFYVKVLIYNNYLILKLFDKAFLLEDASKITLSNKFVGQMSIENSSHSVQFALSPSQYDKISDWISKNIVI